MAQKTSAKPRRGIKEFIRKFFVSLKRAPQNIALVVLAAAFLVYSLNLTSISNTTAKVSLSNMGQCEFAAMLFSILAFVCFLRAFPRREKPKLAMLVVMFVMMAGLIFVDIVYYNRILTAVADGFVINGDTAYVAVAQNVVVVHSILIGVTLLLLVTLPVYSKILKSINTSIDVEDNGEIGTIDISGEE